MLSYSFFVIDFQIDGIYRQFLLYLYIVELSCLIYLQIVYLIFINFHD